MALHARVASSSQWAEMNQPINPQLPATARRLSGGVHETRTGSAFRSHAQSLEDAALWKALRDVRAGQYLDIGAYHPLRDSVSAGFYERGWRGISVDPLPGLSDLYAEARRDELFIAAAISNRLGPVTLARVEETGLSAIDGPSPDKVRVDTMALSALLDRLSGPIHWMKIDVEGHEAAVIDSWGDHPARPWILCIECDDDAGKDPDWHSALLARDYEHVRSDGLNRFYLHQRQAHRMADLAASPGIRDHILIT
ncbi:MAG: FkbM family methyltransferase, partial [Pseudomonadota bacterium]